MEEVLMLFLNRSSDTRKLHSTELHFFSSSAQNGMNATDMAEPIVGSSHQHYSA